VTSRFLGVALAALLLLATVGEGGGSPRSLALWHGALALLVAAAILLPDRRKVGATLPAPLVTSLTVFLVCVALGALRAPYGYAAWLTCLELACWLAVAALAVRLGAGWLRTAVFPLLAAAGIHGALVLVEWWRGTGQRPAGTFLNPNHMGLWLVAVLLWGAGAAAHSRDRRLHALFLFAAPPVLAAIVLSGSRGAFVALLAGGVCFLVLSWRGVAPAMRVALVAGLAIVLFLVGLAILQRGFDPFRYHRVKIWKASLGALATDPFWGTGPGQFSDAAANLQFPDGDGPLRYDRRFDATHSDLVRLPVELGAPATVALLFALVLAARSMIRRRRGGELPPGADGAIAALVAIGAQALVDNQSRWPAVYLLAAALLGATLSVAVVRGERQASIPRLVLAGTVVLGFFVADFAPYLAWREASGIARRALPAAELARMERAATLNRVHPYYRLRLARHLLAQPDPWSVDDYATAREFAELAIRLNPAGAVFRRGLARVEARACRQLRPDVGCRQRVRQLYEGAEALSRFDPSMSIELAGFLLDTGDPVGARRAAERALSIEPEAALPRLLLADAFIEFGSESDLHTAGWLLEEAAERAERWKAWKAEGYGRELLTVVPSTAERLQRKLRTAESDLASSSP